MCTVHSVFFTLVLLLPGSMVEDDLTNTTVHGLLGVERVSVFQTVTQEVHEMASYTQNIHLNMLFC